MRIVENSKLCMFTEPFIPRGKICFQLRVSQWIMTGHQGRNLSKARTWRQEMKEQPWRSTTNQFPNFVFLSLWLCAYITTCTLMVLSMFIVGWVLLYQPFTKKMCHSLGYRLTWWCYFKWHFFLPRRPWLEPSWQRINEHTYMTPQHPTNLLEVWKY